MGGLRAEVMPMPSFDYPCREATPEERKWARRLERVLKDSPSSIELVTAGYNRLYLIDPVIADGRDLHFDGLGADGGGTGHRWIVGAVSSKCTIHGVSG